MTSKRLATPIFLIALLVSAVGFASISWNKPATKDREVTFTWTKGDATDQEWCFQEEGDSEWDCESQCDGEDTCTYTFTRSGEGKVMFKAKGNRGAIEKTKKVKVED